MNTPLVGLILHTLDMMFTVRIPYLSILQVVAHHCNLSYVSTITEVDSHGTLLHGIELELPLLFSTDTPRRLFFWSSTDSILPDPYDDGALQAINCLEVIYGLTIMDYNYRHLILYREAMRQLFSVANRGAHLARTVLTQSEYAAPIHVDLVSAAEELLQEIASITNPL